MLALSLRKASFVAYFSHLPPQEAIEKCHQLQGSSELCSDIDNWKAYVAKRYGLKYSLQRPDLTTAEEWQAQAVALEKPGNVNKYYAFVFRDFPPMLFSERELFVSDFRRNYQLYTELFQIGVELPGIPIIVSDNSRQLTFHVCHFYVQDRDYNFGDDIDVKHLSHDRTIFESQSLCREWMLELFVPYYSIYASKGYTPSGFSVEYTTISSIGISHWDHARANNIDEILAILNSLFIEGQSFKMILTLKGPKEQKGLTRVRRSKRESIIINLAYIPARLV